MVRVLVTVLLGIARVKRLIALAELLECVLLLHLLGVRAGISLVIPINQSFVNVTSEGITYFWGEMLRVRSLFFKS